jgi:hypothetical protein
LLKLDLFASYPWQQVVGPEPNDDPICLQFVANDSQSFSDDVFDIERSVDLCTLLEMGADTFDHGVRAVSGSHHELQRAPDFVKIRFGTIKPIQSCIRTGDNGSKGLLDFMGK